MVHWSFAFLASNASRAKLLATNYFSLLEDGAIDPLKYTFNKSDQTV